MPRKSPNETPATSDLLDQIEDRIEALKLAYERYFSGVDRVPPTRDLDAVKRLIHLQLRTQIRSPVGRFRFQNLRARLVTYEQYWTRILTQIEKGTFKRVLAEAQRRTRVARQRAVDERAERIKGAEAELGAEAPSEDATSAVPRRRKSPPPAPPTKAPDLPDGMDAKTARSLFRDFVKAKRAAGENTDGLTYGGLVTKLARELPKLQARHGGEVRFEVSTSQGKVRLRARKGSK